MNSKLQELIDTLKDDLWEVQEQTFSGEILLLFIQVEYDYREEIEVSSSGVISRMYSYIREQEIPRELSLEELSICLEMVKLLKEIRCQN